VSFPIVKLSQVLKLEYGKALPDVDRDIDGLYAAYGANGEKSRTNKFLYDKPSIIVGRKGSAGELTFVKNKFWALDVTYYVTHNENESDLTYLYYALKTKNLTSYARGVKPGINRNDVYELEIPLPPLATQKKIVAKLDAIFTEIDKATASAESNVKNAEALFQSYLTQVFERDGNGFLSTTLGNFYDVRDGTHDSPKFHESGYPLVTSKNLKNGSISFEKIQYVSKEDYLSISQRSGVKKGDVLMAMIGTIGNPVVIETDVEFAIKNVALFKTNANQSPHFLRYYLGSDYVIRKMEKDAKGATQKFVGLGYLRSFPINVPSLNVQLDIVKELDAYQQHTKQLSISYFRKSNQLRLLKQSILNKAFNGELVKE
jgi:type I restriction enzyme S subunit